MSTAGTRVRKLAVALFFVFVGSDFSRTYTAEPLPAITAPVNDVAKVIDPASAAEMDRMIRELQEKTGDVVVVVTVPTVEPYADAREYAVKLFENEGRGIGEKGKLVALGVRRADHVDAFHERHRGGRAIAFF